MIDEALVELKRAVELLGDDPTIRDHLGDAYRKKGMSKLAFEEWKKVLELEPDNTVVREKLSATQEDTAEGR